MCPDCVQSFGHVSCKGACYRIAFAHASRAPAAPDEAPRAHNVVPGDWLNIQENPHAD